VNKPIARFVSITMLHLVSTNGEPEHDEPAA
jgi:hypothetical protein